MVGSNGHTSRGGRATATVPLREEREEDDVVAQRHEPVLERHLDDEREDVVDERVEDLIVDDKHAHI
jgi:hypothetical protein